MLENIEVEGEEDQVIRGIRSRQESLKSAKVDPVRVIEFIENERMLPMRKHVGAGEIRGARDIHCSLFVPDRYVKRNGRGEVI